MKKEVLIGWVLLAVSLVFIVRGCSEQLERGGRSLREHELEMAKLGYTQEIVFSKNSLGRRVWVKK